MSPENACEPQGTLGKIHHGSQIGGLGASPAEALGSSDWCHPTAVQGPLPGSPPPHTAILRLRTLLLASL